jgi:hypothetical protein
VVYQSLFPKKVRGYRHPWLEEPILEYYLYTHNFDLIDEEMGDWVWRLGR